MKRFASIWLMDWPVTAWRAARPSPPETAAHRTDPTPFALVERTTRGLILHALNPAARALGLKLHQSHADACAIVPALVSAPADPLEDAKALRRLAGWMERYSPFVSLDQSPGGLEGLFLDLTGGQHLFGGEAAMAGAMLASLARLGVPARIGVADTPGAAWALARYGEETPAMAPEGGSRAALAGLPVAALRLEPSAIQLLNRFGLRRIGALSALPRAALARRFQDAEALNVLQRLDQAMGHLPEPLIPVTAPAVYRVQHIFAEPMTNLEAVAIEAAALADRLAQALEQDGVGARRLHLTGFRVDGRTTRLDVRLSAASRRAAHLLRLFKDKGFEHLDLGFGIDALALCAPVTEPLHARQTTLETGALAGARQADAHARDALVDRLSARLGEGAVLAAHLAESWLPETAETLGPYASRSEAAPNPAIGPRPILLFDPPEPIDAVAELPDGAPARFTWRRAARRVLRASGPERLSPEWWKASGSGKQKRTRDYYRVEDDHGGRYWVFREGLYDGRDVDPPPSWWMQGLFA
jgi:protein ImuB